MSEVIYKGPHYTACAMSDGSLIVTRNGKQRGTRLIGNTTADWIDNIRSAVAGGDLKEAAMLCRALVPPPSDRTRSL